MMSILRTTAICTLFSLPVHADPLKVVTDIAPVHGLVAAVLGDLASPEKLIAPGQSPHFGDLRPSQARALAQADFVVWMGHELAPWLEDSVETLASNATHIELLDVEGTESLKSRSLDEIRAGHEDHDDHKEHDHEGHDHDDHKDHDDHDDHKYHEGHADHEDHDHGDHAEHDEDHEGHDHEDHADHDDHNEHEDHADHEGHEEGHEEGHDDDHADHEHHHHHGENDPHAWLAPHNATLWLGAIAAEFGKKDPENAATYAANAKAAAAAIAEADAAAKARLDPVKTAPFLVRHDAYQFLENHYGLQVLGALNLSDASAPSAGEIAELRHDIQAAGPLCVLVERPADAEMAEGLLTGLEFRIKVADPLGADIENGAGFYPAFLTEITSSIADCLTGE